MDKKMLYVKVLCLQNAEMTLDFLLLFYIDSRPNPLSKSYAELE